MPWAPCAVIVPPTNAEHLPQDLCGSVMKAKAFSFRSSCNRCGPGIDSSGITSLNTLEREKNGVIFGVISYAEPSIRFMASLIDCGAGIWAHNEVEYLKLGDIYTH